MGVTVLDERKFLADLRKQNEEAFLKAVTRYDDQVAPSMRARGYKLKNRSARTVAFIFGEICFERNRWYKKGTCKVPVDEWLGLEKHSRFSMELIYQINQISTCTTYRKTADLIEFMTGINLTKDTVLKAVKRAAALKKEQEEYDLLSLTEVTEENKKSPERLYIEGDGVWVKTRSKQGEEAKYSNISHYVIHTGSEQVGQSKRRQLKNKKNVLSLSGSKAKEQALDYVHQTYKTGKGTTLITNSDGGPGYGGKVFKDFAAAFKVQRHEHFWDPYHLQQEIEKNYKAQPEELKELLKQAIYQHDFDLLQTTIDTTESLIDDEEETASFQDFARRLKRNFSYTKPASLRNLPKKGIGVMESQHRRLTYRMKNQGMIWSLEGAEIMANMILAVEEGTLRELFFGDWRKASQKMKGLDKVSGGKVRKYMNHLDSLKRNFQIGEGRKAHKARRQSHKKGATILR
ncbi:DDE transposase [Streptococcus sanguinis]|uniref:DDE transposase n=1 Tax=Streptococcus sanguinis TaxID=1305 RepID=A0AAJ5TAK1_STRSA|nr:ISLre2 family transposase [Streptococcus sanguinis]VDY71604.1 DDE transposase [Streptococcus sanguinis]